MHDMFFLQELLGRWGRDVGQVRTDLTLAGSPERSVSRLVLEDRSGDCLVLEELDRSSLPVKKRVDGRLMLLQQRGLRVPASCPGLDGRAIQEAHGRFWRLTPYVSGLPLDHDVYWQDAWRGRALAAYLAEMRHAAQNMKLEEPCFDLPGYVEQIRRDALRHHPEVARDLEPVWRRLDALPEIHASLPVVFSHGDPHPENIIWGQSDIRAVIDWEFCGPKHALYDPALIIGCVGSEAPEAADGPFVREFVHSLGQAGLLDPQGRHVLPVMVLAQRTAWLAEWLRRDDRDMIEFEVFYMKLLAVRCSSECKDSSSS